MRDGGHIPTKGIVLAHSRPEMTENIHAFLCMDIKIATLTGLASARKRCFQAPWTKEHHESGWLSICYFLFGFMNSIPPTDMEISIHFSSSGLYSGIRTFTNFAFEAAQLPIFSRRSFLVLKYLLVSS